MRLVRFEDPTDGVAVDLHPLLTVVTGAHHGARERLLQAVAALPRGTDPGAGGSVEVHGVMLDLNLESLVLLELHDDLDVIVRADDLPNHAHPEATVAAERVGEGRAEVLRAELAEARAAYDEAMAAVEEAEELRAELRRQLAGVTDQRRWLKSEIDGARGALSPAAEADLHAARDDLAVLRQRSEDAAAAVAAQRTALEAALDTLGQQLEEHGREMSRLEIDRTSRVRSALDSLATAMDPKLVPSEVANVLGEELAALDERLAMLESRAATGRAQVQELTARRDAAYDAFVAAEAALRSPDLDQAAVSELEGVHDEIFELDGRIAKLSAGRLRRRMLELREREGLLLSGLGFESWSSYVMGITSEGAETERKRRYDVAKATYEFAEDEVAKAAAAPMGAASELADARQRRRDILTRAEVILGRVPGDDPVAELRNHLEPAAVDLAHAVAELRGALDHVGAVGIPFEAADAKRFADAWLIDEVASRRARAVEIAEAHRTIEIEVDRVNRELSELPEAADLLEPLPDDHPEVIAAQARIDDLVTALDLHRKAAALVAEFEGLDAEQAEREAELVERSEGTERSVAEAQALVATAQALTTTLEAALTELGHDAFESHRQGTAADGRSVDGLEWYLLSRLAQQRSLSFVGSVPLAIDDAFSEWTAEELVEVHRRLARMSEVIQVVYLSDDVDVVAWARELGHERASVVDLSSAG